MSEPLLPPDLPDDPDSALAGEYVLRLLGPEETAACAEREARDADFAARVAAWRADLEAFDGAFTPRVPPADLGKRITERVFGAEPSGFARLWRNAGLWRAVAAAAVIAAVVLGRPVVPPPVPGEGPARLVSALASQGDSDVALLAIWEPQASVLAINRTGGAAAPGQALQLWVVEDNTPVSLGMLPDGPLARVAVPREIAARLGPGSTLAVSEEPPGGSPTPTRVVAAGAISAL